MKIAYLAAGIVVGLPLLFFVVMYGASELGGEVVTLERAEADGAVSHVRIWIVDQGDVSWIEHGEAEAYWIGQLANSPEVVLNRQGRTTSYTGTPDRSAHDLYHRLRGEKYGWADQLVGLLTGGSAGCQGVPVRLESDSAR